MSGQAEQLQQTMAFFKLRATSQARSPAAVEGRRPAKAKRPVVHAAGSPAAAGNLALADSPDEAHFTRF
jgi:methyl-accepting chemotaxis protein